MVDISKFKDLYISETEDQMQVLNDNLLVLEKNVSSGNVDKIEKNILNDLMRASHTVKGSSATMGFTDMAYLAHVMEDVFDFARNDKIQITSDIVDVVFSAIDKLEASLDSVKKFDKELKIKNLAEKIKKITGVNTIGVGKSSHVNEQKVEEPKKVEQTVLEKKEIKKDEQIQKTEKSIVEDVCEERDAAKKIDYIKVPIKRLDSLMDLVEELVIDRMTLRQLCLDNSELREVTNHIDLLIQSLQYEVMQARLVPVDQVFARFPRMVRDLSRSQNKNIDFRISGGDLELDRSIVDKLGEPLVHLLRNAVDHGIKEKGYIELTAKRDRENAVIIVENDDQSIDPEKVKSAAIKRGIISVKEANEMREEQIINLIFHPQLSTNEEITEISGRGVGLSVVKRFAESSGGRVVVEILDPGTRFKLELPLTLAIINSLMVEVEKNIFAVPFSVILRSVIVKRKDIRSMADNKMVIVDDTDIPLIDLKEYFHFVSKLLGTEMKMPEKKENNDDEDEDGNEDIIVVIVKKDNDLAGLVVDKLLNEQEVTVKPLSSVLRGVGGFSGSTILGDGKTILILDVFSLIKKIK